MYTIDETSWGYRLTFSQSVSAEEMSQWIDNSIETLQSVKHRFGVLVDMRTLFPLDQDAQEIMKAGQKLYQDSGMQRSAVILNSAVLTMQFKRIAKSTGIYRRERYIDASTQPQWEALAIAWIEDGIDPDA